MLHNNALMATTMKPA